MSIKTLDEGVIITRRWFRWIHIPLSVVFFMLIYGLFFSEISTAEFLINPLTWFMIGLAYYTLTGFVNTTVVRVDPQRLTVKQGPLLPRRSRHIEAQDIRQLYMKLHVERGRKSKTTTYQVWLTRQGGRPEKLVTDLETPEQALFIEQEIERYLGLKDQAMPGEHEITAYNFSGWRKFAERNRLHYTPGKLPEGYRVSGDYHGYIADLIVVPSPLKLGPQTRLTLTAADHVPGPKDPDQQLALDDVADLFAAPLQASSRLTGKFTLTDKGQKFIYERSGGVETSEIRLQHAFDILYRLIETYPYIATLGGEAIPLLQPIAGDRKHPLRAVAAHLIQEIGPTTEYLHRQGEASLVCPRCLTRCAAHEADISWLSAVTYFGCRACHQSKDFLSVETIAAVLDNQADFEPVQQGRTLTVNWLSRRTRFDFDSVTIIRATDEEIERFAVQVGNDTDPVRRSHYEQMGCVVSPDCKLSQNTLRILQRTFGRVDIQADIADIKKDISLSKRRRQTGQATDDSSQMGESDG